MTQRSYPQPGTTEEYRTGSRFSFENAERHVRCAHLLDHGREWGPAVTHLILATEEAAKAIVLDDKAAKGAQSTYTDAELARLLRSHDPRHPIALAKSKPPPWWADLGLALGAWVVFLLTPEQMRPSLEEVQAHGIQAAADRAARLPSDWPNRAKDRRELGMYASFTESGWVSPADVNEKEYRDLHRIVSVFVRETGEKLGLRPPRLPIPLVPVGSSSEHSASATIKEPGENSRSAKVSVRLARVSRRPRPTEGQAPK